MNTPINLNSPHPFAIRVTSRETTVVRLVVPKSPAGAKPIAAKARRHRYRAEFLSGPFLGLSTDGHPTADGALGALVRLAAGRCKTPDQVFDLVARMLDRPASRTPDETIGRAVRCAAQAPGRRNAGVTVRFVHPENRPQLAAAPERGGAA